MNDLLQKILVKNKNICFLGETANYIPILSEVSKNLLGICVTDNTGVYFAGDYKTKFTIQSISKSFTLLFALMLFGEETVFKYVGMEPLGDAFNSMIKLELDHEKKPYNPMVNAGAIVISSLLAEKNSKENFNLFLNFLKKISGNENLKINNSVFDCENKTGDRNRAIAYFLNGEKLLKSSPSETLDFYFKQCSIEITAKDLSTMAFFLARDGILNDATKLASSKHIKIVRSQAALCGLYDGSGEFATKVGIPSKSGVGGGILSIVPNKMGIGIFGPSLNKKGNSIAGIEVLKDLSNELNLSIF